MLIHQTCLEFYVDYKNSMMYGVYNLKKATKSLRFFYAPRMNEAQAIKEVEWNPTINWQFVK